MTGDVRLPAEQRGHELIDKQLAQAGWAVQDVKNQALGAAQGVAVREVTMKSGHGRADYLLYLDKGIVGVIEAKPMGQTLSGVEWQSSMYAEGLTETQQMRATMVDGKLPFVFEASGTETHFTNGFDPHPRAREVFNSTPMREIVTAILVDGGFYRRRREGIAAGGYGGNRPLNGYLSRWDAQGAFIRSRYTQSTRQRCDSSECTLAFFV